MVAEELSIKGLTTSDQDPAASSRNRPVAKRPRGPSFIPSVPAKKANKASFPKPSTSSASSSAIEVKQEQFVAEDADLDADFDDGGGGAGDDDDYDDEDYAPSGSAKKRKSAAAASGGGGSGSGNGSFAEGQDGDDDQGNPSFHFSRKVPHWKIFLLLEILLAFIPFLNTPRIQVVRR